MKTSSNTVDGISGGTIMSSSDRVNLMIKLESGKTIDGGKFGDVIRYDNQTINDTVVKNANVGSPIFFWL